MSTRCDAPDPPVYFSILPSGDFNLACRCLICPRCGHHTGNSTQGHWWQWCRVTGSMRNRHMCCPDDCELDT
jgi:hypothetical protein